jgi:hypothetical protein
VAHCLLITQRTSVLKREPQFVPHVHPCGRTVLKSQLKWITAWWRGVIFYHRRFGWWGSHRWSPDRWSCWTIDRIYRSWLPDHYLKRGCWVLAVLRELKADRHRALRFLFVSRVLKIIVVHHSSYYWDGCSRLFSCTAVNDDVSYRNSMPIGNLSS